MKNKMAMKRWENVFPGRLLVLLASELTMMLVRLGTSCVCVCVWHSVLVHANDCKEGKKTKTKTREESQWFSVGSQSNFLEKKAGIS